MTVEGSDASVTAESGPDGAALLSLPVPAPRLWSPQDPHLYRILARAESQEGADEVTCTAGLRRIEVTGDEIRLNGSRLFLRGVLDQGYWPGTGLSAPSPEALRRDLALARAAGYNLVRKHLKLEDPRWLHFADQAGMLVWAEPPSTSRFSAESVAAFRQGLASLVERDANHPCIVVWGCFNEEWGLDWQVSDDPARQQAVAQAVDLVRELDGSRPVVDNSGWTHVGGDLIDWHYYEADLERWAKNVDALVTDEAAEIPVALHPDTVTMKPLLARRRTRRLRLRDLPNLNSEYGMGFTSVERGWYLKWQTQELRRHNRLAGYVYTELYDIEHEMAGLLAADRSAKDLGNISPADVNAETVLVLDVVPVRPGIDLELAGREASFAVRCSHHGLSAGARPAALGLAAAPRRDARARASAGRPRGAGRERRPVAVRRAVRAERAGPGDRATAAGLDGWPAAAMAAGRDRGTGGDKPGRRPPAGDRQTPRGDEGTQQVVRESLWLSAPITVVVAFLHPALRCTGSSATSGLALTGRRTAPAFLRAAVGAQHAEGVDRDEAAPVGFGGGRPGRPVEHPAAVVALGGGQVVQVRLDRARVEQAARDRAGQRREVERRERFALRVRVERDEPGREQQRADPVEGGLGPRPVRYALEEGEHAEHHVAVLRLGHLARSPTT